MTPETEERVLTGLGRIEESVNQLKDLYKSDHEKVEKHERVYQNGKLLGVPALAALHLTLKHLFGRL